MQLVSWYSQWTTLRQLPLNSIVVGYGSEPSVSISYETHGVELLNDSRKRNITTETTHLANKSYHMVISETRRGRKRLQTLYLLASRYANKKV